MTPEQAKALRVLVAGNPALRALLTDARVFVAGELALLTASHGRQDGTIGSEGQVMVSVARALLARLDAVLTG